MASDVRGEQLRNFEALRGAIITLSSTTVIAKIDALFALRDFGQ